VYSENSAELIAFELKSGNKSEHLFKEFITDSVFFPETYQRLMLEKWGIHSDSRQNRQRGAGCLWNAAL
jgi:hypothetical protein